MTAAPLIDIHETPNMLKPVLWANIKALLHGNNIFPSPVFLQYLTLTTFIDILETQFLNLEQRKKVKAYFLVFLKGKYLN
jgi:hypothetical protein